MNHAFFFTNTSVTSDANVTFDKGYDRVRWPAMEWLSLTKAI